MEGKRCKSANNKKQTTNVEWTAMIGIRKGESYLLREKVTYCTCEDTHTHDERNGEFRVQGRRNRVSKRENERDRETARE